MVSSDEHWNPMLKPSRRDLMKRTEEAANEGVHNKTEVEGIVEGNEEPNVEAPTGPELDHNPFEGGEDQSNHQDDSVNLSSSDSPGTSPVQETTKGLTNDEEMANDYDDNEFYAGLKKQEAAEEPQDDPLYSELNKEEELQDDPFYSELNEKGVDKQADSQDEPVYSELSGKAEANGINSDNQVQVTEPEAAVSSQLKEQDAAEESFFEKLSGGERDEETASKPTDQQGRKKPVNHNRVPSVFANSTDDDFFSKELSGQQPDSGVPKKSQHSRVPSVFANSEDDDFFSKQLSETIPESAEDENADGKEEHVAPLPKDKHKKSFHTRVPSAFVRHENEDDFFSSLAEDQPTTIEEEPQPQPAPSQEAPSISTTQPEIQGQPNTAGADAFGFLADDDDDLLEEEEQEQQKPEQESLHKQESSKDLSASLAFLEQDDDLLPEDYEEEDDNKPLAEVKQNASLKQYASDSYFASKTPNMPSGGFSQSNYTTPYTPYQQPQPQQQQHQQPHPLQKTKSFVAETANNSFDLPSGMVPKQSIRRVTSFQQPPTNVYSTPSTGLTPAQQPPGSAQSAGGPPKSNKPFFDELPLPPPKKPQPPRRNVSQEGMPHPPAQGIAPSVTSPPIGGPPRNPYAPPQPSNYAPRHGHSRSSSGDASSVRSTSPLNYRPSMSNAQASQVPQVPLAPPMEYVPPPQSSSSVAQPRNPYAPTPNQQQPQRPPSSSSYAPQKESPGNYAPSSYQPAKTATPPPPPPSSSAFNTSSPSRNPYDPHNLQRSPRQQVPKPPQSGYQPSPPAGATGGVPPPPPSTGHPGGQRKPPLSAASSFGDLPEGLGSRPVISPRGSVADGMPERSASRSRQPLVPPPATQQATPGAPPPASLNLERSRQHSEATPRQYAKPTPPQTVGHGGTSTIAPEPPMDNEALARRQFPAFRWGVGKRSAAVIPPAIAFGGSNTQIKVVNAGDVILDNEQLTKFPTQIMGLKGPVKSKKKELEKWCAEKVNKLQNDMEGRATYSARSEHKVVLWKILQILLKSEGPITKGIQDHLQEIRTILHPGVQPLASQDENAFTKASDMYNSAMNMTKPPAKPNDPYAVASFGPDELKSIMGEIEVGNREGALRNAMEKHLWAHALIIAGSLGADHWHRTVMEFVRSEVKANAVPSAKDLAFMYRVFSGAGGDSVSELYPSQRAQQVSDDGSLDKTLNDWGVHLSLIISNASPKNTEAILSLGKALLKHGYVEAAHVCLLLSGYNTFFGNNDAELPGAMLLGADGMHGNCGLGRDGDSILASELFEFIFFSNPPPEIGNNVTHFPHLLLYKVVHAEMLADHGVFGEAQKVCDNVATFIKNAPKGTQFNRVFLERLEHVNARINSIDESASSSGWFGGKLGRPKLDKIWMQSFNKFVAGDDEDVASEASSTDKEGAIFKKLASTPSVSRVESATDLSGQYFSGGTHTPEYGYSHGAAGSRAVSNPYAPAPAAGGGDRPGSLHRIQSYAGLPSAPMGSQYGGLGIQPTSSPVYGPSSTSRRNNFGQDLGGSRPVSPNTSSIARSTSVGGYEEHAPPPSRPGSAGSSSVMNKTAPPPPAVHKPPMTRAYTPENVTIDQNSASAQASPASSLASTSPRRQPPPPRGYNPYAPQAAGHQNGSVRPSSASSNYNPYAPVAPSPKQQQPPEPSTETEDYGVSVDNPYGAIYGGAPPPPLPAAAAEPAEETARPQEATEEEEPRAEPEDTYEPPSYGYQPPPLEEEEVPDAESGGGNLFVPVAGAAAAPIPKAPMPATGHYTPPTAEPIPEENEEEAEDLGVSNAKSETDRIFEEAKRKQDEEDERKRQEQENKKSGKWFSWLRKGDDQQPKAVRAKLGEENSFYYDEKLKRWVNKKAPVEEQKAAAPPPPPKASKTPSTTSTPTGFESSPNPSTGGTPPSGGPPPARPSTGPPKPSTGGGLDDLLAAAPASGAKKHARRSARNRYVDIMQK